jgi:MoxR-like ATPase
MTGDIEIRRIDSKYLVPQADDSYEDVGLTDVLKSLAFGPNLILKGPKGAGKTLAIEQFAAEMGVPLLRQDCSDETTTRELIGSFVDVGTYALGSLTAAIDVANEDGGCIVVLEEINTLPPTAQKILKSIADYRQAIGVSKIGRVFRVKKSSRIWLIGTMNPNYGGTYNLNEDFRSRFEFLTVNYMPTANERALLHRQFPSPPSAREKQMIDKILNLAKESRSGEMEYALSTRDLVQFVKNFALLGSWEKALKLLEGKYEGENIKNFQARVMSTFQVNLTEIKLF